MLHNNHGHGHGIPLWQKIVFPIWLWKSLIHDKHEAFRFKYDTKAITAVEKDIMPGVKKQLYAWSVIYYLIVFVLPSIAIKHECEKTFEMWLYYIYGTYLISCAIWEI